MTDDREVARIAWWLTSGEHAAVMSTRPNESRAYAEVHGKPRLTLFRKGIFGPTDYCDPARFQLTPLGIAVRSYLQSKGGDA